MEFKEKNVVKGGKKVRMMKKLMHSLLLVLLIIGLAGCGSESEPEENETEEMEQDEGENEMDEDENKMDEE